MKSLHRWLQLLHPITVSTTLTEIYARSLVNELFLYRWQQLNNAQKEIHRILEYEIYNTYDSGECKTPELS